MHRGESRRFELKDEELDAGVDYTSRVCAVREGEDGNQLLGPYSNLVSFSNPLPTPEVSTSSKSLSSSSFKSNLSTTAQVSNTLELGIHSLSTFSKQIEWQTTEWQTFFGFASVFCLFHNMFENIFCQFDRNQYLQLCDNDFKVADFKTWILHK